MIKSGFKYRAPSADDLFAAPVSLTGTPDWNGLYAELASAPKATFLLAPAIEVLEPALTLAPALVAVDADPVQAPALEAREVAPDVPTAAGEIVTTPLYASFASGNIVVMRVGATGGLGSTLSAIATAVYLDEYTASGAFVQTINLPTTDSGANQAFTDSGSATSDGFVTRSGDGRYLLLAGYDTAVATSGVASSTTGQSGAYTNNRVIARVNAAGVVDTTTTLGTADSGTNIRSAFSNDGSAIYASGGGGIFYTTFGSTTNATVLAPFNARNVGIVAGQLYGTSGSGTTRIATVGTGTPTTTGQTVTNLAGLSTTNSISPYAFYFADLSQTVAGVDTLYVADDTTTPGLKKYSFDGTTWSLLGTTAISSLRGLTGYVDANGVHLVGTTSGGAINGSIVSLLDATGYGAAVTTSFSTLVSVTGNTTFRGVAFAPGLLRISVSSPAVSQNEGADGATTSYTYVLTRESGTASATVAYAVTGTGTNPADANDFVGGILPSGTATFVGTALTTTVTIQVAGDATVEQNELFTLALSNPSAGYVLGATPTQTGTIINDDLPAMTISDVSRVEGNAGTQTYTFTVSLSAPAPVGGVTFDIETVDSLATAGTDYIAKRLTNQTIAEGSSTYTFDVTVIGDTAVESDETFFVDATRVIGATYSRAGVGTIINDDVAAPALRINDVSRVEGNAGTQTYTFTVSLSAPAPAGGVTFDIATADNTGSAGTDYVAKTLTSQTIPAGSSSYTFDVTVNGDTTVEPNETFLVNVTNVVGATVSDGQGLGTITNDDTPTLAINDVTVNEGDGTATFTVTLSAASTQTVTVAYAAADGTAGSTDYASTSGTATFTPGTLTQTFTVPITNDAVYEAVEQFVVNLSGATNASIADAQGVATITDNDPAPTLAIDDLTFAEGTGGTKTVTFTVTLTGATALPISVDYATAAGTATANTDYGSASGTLTFGASTAATQSQTFTVSIAGDIFSENDETFFVNLSNATNGATISDAQGVGTIVNDDLPTLSINDVTMVEGNSGTVTYFFTVSTNGVVPAGGVTFDIATADNTATAGSDYVATALAGQTIAAGASSYTFNVTVNRDTVPEANESFFVDLTNVTGAAVTRGRGTGTITSDDLIIPGGSAATTFVLADPYSATLLEGTTRTQTAGVAVSVTSATGPANVVINGTLTDTASGARAINFGTAVPSGSLSVGANGSVQSLNGDAVRVQSPHGTINVNNLGSIIASVTPFTPTVGGTNPGTGFAITYNAALGENDPLSSDFETGGIIFNGRYDITTALIRADNGDAIRLGSHQALVNFGTINGNGQINDASTNNSFNGANGNPNTSTAQTYDISRGVRVNQAGATNIEVDNYGTITGAQHGVDVGATDANLILVYNYAGGQIIGRNGSGVGADTTGASVYTVIVENYGIIRGEYAPLYDRAGYVTTDGDGDGVDIDGAATINNYRGGEITATGAGGYDSNGRANNSEAISIGGGKITNAGTISGANFGIVVNNDSNADGSRSGVAGTMIVNATTGSITGGTGFAIRLENKTGTTADNDSIVNYGSITGNGDVPTGTVLRQDGTADAGTVGTLDGVTYTAANDAGSARFIRGDGSAIQTGEGVDYVTNYGSITGGTSGRAINLEGGSDDLTLFTGSSIEGRIDGGAGFDYLDLVLDNRDGRNTDAGANSGATTGTIRNVVDFEVLTVYSGDWTVADDQSYQYLSLIVGTLTINSGVTLTIGTTGGEGATPGASLIDNGTLVLNPGGMGGGSFYAISGTGTLVKAGDNLADLSYASTYSGGTALNGGSLQLHVVGAAGTGAIAFGAGAQSLIISNAALDGGSAHLLGNTIDGFGANEDRFIFDDIASGNATATYNARTGLLTVVANTDGATLATINVGTEYGNDAVRIQDDGFGRLAVQLVTASPSGYAGGSGNDTIVAPDTPSRVDASQGGNDTVQGGTANDAIFFGAALTAADTVNGGAGSDQLAIQGDYTAANALVLGATTVTNVETFVVLPGFDYNVTSAQETVAAGQTLSVYGSSLGAGDNLTFDGSAETDGRFVMYGGLGIDLLTGGSGNDAFYFGRDGRFGASDLVNGGGGTDTVALAGSYTLTVTGTQFIGIETLALLDDTVAPTYNIMLADSWALPGEAKTITFNTLRTGAVVDGSAEANASFTFYGGNGNDTITGGGGNDILFGGKGADRLTGGAGADIFGYTSASHSIGSAYDTIVGFDASVDRIDLPFTVNAIDPDASGAMGAGTLDQALTTALAGLQLGHAVQFTVTDGALATHVFEVIDANGQVGYQAGEDMVIELEGLIAPITPATTTFF